MILGSLFKCDHGRKFIMNLEIVVSNRDSGILDDRIYIRPLGSQSPLIPFHFTIEDINKFAFFRNKLLTNENIRLLYKHTYETER